MRSIVRLLCALGIIAALTNSTREHSADNTRLRQLMEFVAQEMGVSVAGVPLPRIKYYSHEELKQAFYGPLVYYLVRRNMLPERDPVLAAFNFSRQRMMLRADIDYGTPEQEFVLVHELVHYLQLVYRHDYFDRALSCLNHLEWEAYRVSNLWVRLTGLGKEYDDASVQKRTRCK